MIKAERSKQYQVLLIEDDPLIAKTLRMSLPYQGFNVKVSGSFHQGLIEFHSQSYDLILLDVNLPDGSGLKLCEEIRKKDELIPVLMLTAKIDEESAVRGLECGADDYIRKPYGVKELVARMERLLERKKKNSNLIRFGPLKVDLQKRLSWVEDIQLNLGKREFEILILLIKKSGDAVTRNEILAKLDEEAELYDRTIDSHLSHLRRKIRDAGSTQIQIQPIYGIGYRLAESISPNKETRIGSTSS